MSRESELYKDKIEVSLDGRQIFYLFFGGAVIVGLVFVLGVMVGRRVEARGHVERAQTAAAVDPLAALDRLEGGGGLSFQGALRGADARTSDVEKTIGEIAKARQEAKPDPKKKVEARPEVKAEVKPEAKAEVNPEAKADAKPEAKPEVKAEVKLEARKPEDKKLEARKPDDKKLEAKGEDKKVEARPEDKKPEKKADKLEAKIDRPEAKPEPKKDDKKAEAKADDKTKKVEAKADEPRKSDKPKFTLQLSSFQDKGEAESYLAQVKSSGFTPYITEAEVEGKTFYRVRLGSYRSLEAANDAKVDFEKSSKKSASVMKL